MDKLELANASTTDSHIIYHNPSRHQIQYNLTPQCTISDQDSVVLGCGDHSTRSIHNELWVEGNDEKDEIFNSKQVSVLQILGVRPNCPKAKRWAQSSMDIHEIEKHCPWFSTLQIPYVLDHLILNHELSNVRIKKVAAGSIHCLFLTEDGFVYGMGHNKDGQVMNYDRNHKLQRSDVSLPTLMLWLVERNIRIKDIACAGWFSAFITTDDELYTVGRFGSNYQMTLEPVLRQTNGVISVFGVGNEHLVFQCDSSQSGGQVYALGSNRFGQLGVSRTNYENHAVEAQVVTESSDTLMPFNFCRLTQIDGGTRFTIVLTSQFDVYVAGIVESAFPLTKNGFTKLDLGERIGTAHIKDFSCSFSTAVFLDSMKRVFTLSDLQDMSRTSPFLDASTIANPVVTATAHGFHVINTLTGRLFNLELSGKCRRLVEQQADLNSCQMLENPHYQVASYASGYRLILLLLKSTKKSSLNYFVMNLRKLVSHSTLSDVDFVFE